MNRLLFYVVVLAVIGGVFFIFFQTGQLEALKLKEPRNLAPMGETTRLFIKRDFRPVKGNPLTYFMYQPQPPYPEGLKFPLVIVLHGATGFGYAAEHLVAGNMPLDFPAFVVVPVLPKAQFWIRPGNLAKTRDSSDNFRLPDVAALVQAFSTVYPVDQKRIYVIGCSEGGWGAFGAARYYPNIFTAAVPLSGGWPGKDAAAITRTPMWVMHGTHDSIYPIKNIRETVAYARYRNNNVMFNEFEMGHNCPSPVFYAKTMWHWLFSQKKQDLSSQTK